MKIDNSNIEILNSKDFSIHDYIFNSLSFERETGMIKLFLQKNYSDNCAYIINYINVIAVEMTSCNFWGRSPHIFDFEHIEHSNLTLLPKLYEIQQHMPINPQCKLVLKKDYIETTITFTSGDKLTIVCEYIIID